MNSQKPYQLACWLEYSGLMIQFGGSLSDDPLTIASGILIAPVAILIQKNTKL
jgi:hypothetical protein